MNSHFNEKLSFQIQAARNSDVVQISLLYKETWNRYRGKLPKQLIKSREPSAEQLKQWLKEDRYFVAKRNGKIIGVVGASMKHGTCLLTHMVVEKQHRRKGIGTALAEKVITYAKENNANKVWLDTSPQLTEAITIYKKLGFRKCGHLKNHFWGESIDLYELVF